MEREKEFVINSNENGHMLGYLQNKKSESIWSFKNQLQYNILTNLWKNTFENTQWRQDQNIATGETSQAITSFYFFDYFDFSNIYH